MTRRRTGEPGGAQGRARPARRAARAPSGAGGGRRRSGSGASGRAPAGWKRWAPAERERYLDAGPGRGAGSVQPRGPRRRAVTACPPRRAHGACAVRWPEGQAGAGRPLAPGQGARSAPLGRGRAERGARRGRAGEALPGCSRSISVALRAQSAASAPPASPWSTAGGRSRAAEEVPGEPQGQVRRVPGGRLGQGEGGVPEGERDGRQAHRARPPDAPAQGAEQGAAEGDLLGHQRCPGAAATTPPSTSAPASPGARPAPRGRTSGPSPAPPRPAPAPPAGARRRPSPARTAAAAREPGGRRAPAEAEVHRLQRPEARRRPQDASPVTAAEAALRGAAGRVGAASHGFRLPRSARPAPGRPPTGSTGRGHYTAPARGGDAHRARAPAVAPTAPGASRTRQFPPWVTPRPGGGGPTPARGQALSGTCADRLLAPGPDFSFAAHTSYEPSRSGARRGSASRAQAP